MNKNIIYKLVGVVVLLLVGEGVFGWALYWPVLWYLLDWSLVYWLVFGMGFLLTGLTGVTLGLSSLVLVVGVWFLSFLRELVGKNGWLDVMAVVGVAWLSSLVIGLEFSLVEAVGVAFLMVVLKMRDSREGDIKV